MTALTFFAALLPALAYPLLVWTWRRHDRSVFATLLVAVLWGAVVATTLSLVAERYVTAGLGVTSGSPGPALEAVLVTPALEEALKAVVLLFLLRVVRVETALEGLLVGAAVGLGFAATENYLSYVTAYRALGFGGWVANVAVRTSLTGVMHACATASAGAIVGRFAGRSQVERWIAGPLLGYCAATLIHAGFNGGLLASTQAGGALRILVAAVVTFVLLGLVRWARAAEAGVLLGQLLKEATLHEVMTPNEARVLLGPGVQRTARVAAKRLALLSIREERSPSSVASTRRQELKVLRRQLGALSRAPG